MTTEKGSLKDWDDRHYQSIDDLPPEAWDAVTDFRLKSIADMMAIIGQSINAHGVNPQLIAIALHNNGFKRD